jgi:hypothetical protein
MLLYKKLLLMTFGMTLVLNFVTRQAAYYFVILRSVPATIVAIEN